MADYTRRKAVIIDNKTGEGINYGSINKAKRESRKLQKSGSTVKRG